MTDRPRLVTVREAAAACSMSEDSLRQAVRRGKFPAYKLGTHRNSPIRVDINEIEETWLQHPLNRATA